MARPSFVEKTFTGGSKTVKFVNIFSLESLVLYSTAFSVIKCSDCFVGDTVCCLGSREIGYGLLPGGYGISIHHARCCRE